MESVKFKTVSFRAGAYIYVEEQTYSSEFYIVRQGSLIEENPINNLTNVQNTVIKTGDFFGVLDCMSQRPRLSSVKALEDCILIIVQFEQFEALITQMAPVAMKIIRFFSQQLRQYNTTLSQLTKDEKTLDTHVNLYSLGEYYQNIGKQKLAAYAFSKFIESNPHDPRTTDAEEALKILNIQLDSLLPKEQGIQKTYEAGNPIFLETEKGEDLYIIIDGFVKITKFINNSEVLLGMLREKDIFGEMAILENSLRSASAVASTNIKVLRINKQNFELYIKTHPEIARRIIQLLSDRIWLIYKRLANQLINDPTTKIYDALHTLLQKNRVPLKKGLSYVFDMSPEDLVQFVGLEPESGAKIMDQVLQNDSVLHVENNKIVSRDVYNIRGAVSLSNRNKNRN